MSNDDGKRRAIVTGTNGTVAPVLAEKLRHAGVEVFPWDRSRVPIDDLDAARSLFETVRPDDFYHVATGPPEWAERVALLCESEGIRFLFTSSVSVFSPQQHAPIGIEAAPDATDDYGRYKAECERRVASANSKAVIARLGWQIGDAPGSNNMVDYLHNQCDDDGLLRLNRNWVPSCSFLTDTADALVRLQDEAQPAVYHLEGNPGLSIDVIARGLSDRHGFGWRVESVDGPLVDNRMGDARVRLAPITAP